MRNEIRIQPCYNQDAIVITKDMGLKEVFRQLKRLENQEVAGVYLDKGRPCKCSARSSKFTC